MFSTILLLPLLFTGSAIAATLTSTQITYRSAANNTYTIASTLNSTFKSASYEYTHYGAAESSIDVTPDGNTLIYAPAFAAGQKTGYATSTDYGKSWNFTVPAPNLPRTQPMFNIHDGRYFYWSSNTPGLAFQYSDDQGMTWTKVANGHLHPQINDWAKIVSGKPVRSKLSGNASQILYMSAPSLLSVPVVAGLGPNYQFLAKSLDKGSTWTPVKARPSLKPKDHGGPCGQLSDRERENELLIWGNGLVRPNGTVIFGLRRCKGVSFAISDDEGESWRYSDVGGSSVVPYTKGLGTWVENGNVLVPEPISQDAQGNLYAIWVDDKYILQMSKSTDGAATWSPSIVISSPMANSTTPLMTYHPILTHHPKNPFRAALAYYASPDSGLTWNGYIAETPDISNQQPIWTGFTANEPSQPLQRNLDGHWDQGYQNPFADLIEFVGLKYHPTTGDLVAAFTRKMCSKPMLDAKSFDTGSCADGWDFRAMGDSVWQGYIVFGHH